MTDTLRSYVSLESIQESNIDSSSRVIHDYHATRPAYKIEMTPKSLVFGNVLVGSLSAKQTITVRNAGYLPLSILEIIPVGDSFMASFDAQSSLVPDESFEIIVEFSPHGIGVNTGGIFVDAGEAIGKNFVQLTGNGVPVDGTDTSNNEDGNPIDPMHPPL